MSVRTEGRRCFRLFQGSVFSGIAAKLPAKRARKTAGVAEAHHIRDLRHGILAALYQRKAFVCAVFLQISGYGFARHFFEQAAADLPGEMHLVRKGLKGYHRCR